MSLGLGILGVWRRRVERVVEDHTDEPGDNGGYEYVDGGGNEPGRVAGAASKRRDSVVDDERECSGDGDGGDEAWEWDTFVGWSAVVGEGRGEEEPGVDDRPDVYEADANHYYRHKLFDECMFGGVSGVALFVILVIVVAMVTGTGDAVKPDRQYGDSGLGERRTNGHMVLTHEGGDSIPRDTVGLYGDALNGTITDFGDSGDERIVKPFDENVVSEGDTLAISSDALNEGTVVLLRDSEQSASLTHLDYPTDFNRTPDAINEAD